MIDDMGSSSSCSVALKAGWCGCGLCGEFAGIVVNNALFERYLYDFMSLLLGISVNWWRLSCMSALSAVGAGVCGCGLGVDTENAASDLYRMLCSQIISETACFVMVVVLSISGIQA